MTRTSSLACGAAQAGRTEAAGPETPSGGCRRQNHAIETGDGDGIDPPPPSITRDRSPPPSHAILQVPPVYRYLQVPPLSIDEGYLEGVPGGETTRGYCGAPLPTPPSPPPSIPRVRRRSSPKHPGPALIAAYCGLLRLIAVYCGLLRLIAAYCGVL